MRAKHLRAFVRWGIACAVVSSGILVSCTAPPTSAPPLESGYRPVYDPETLMGITHADGRTPEGWVTDGSALRHAGGAPIAAPLGSGDFELTCQWKSSGTSAPNIDVLVSADLHAKEAAEASNRILNYAEQLPRAPQPLAAGSWNEVRIRVVGGDVSMWLNGVEHPTTTKLSPGDRHLRLEGGPDPVWFQRVLIREVAGDDGTPPSPNAG